jgi:hypothetical protein
VRRCVVSIEGQDHQTHSIEVEAVSLFAAAYERGRMGNVPVVSG